LWGRNMKTAALLLPGSRHEFPLQPFDEILRMEKVGVLRGRTHVGRFNLPLVLAQGGFDFLKGFAADVHQIISSTLCRCKQTGTAVPPGQRQA
jgi:hypothetical protein